MTRPDIIVVGGGVSGLTCASVLAQAQLHVQVWTAAPTNQTTSMIAAAFWYPYRAEPSERVGPWATAGYERFASLAADLTIGPVAGVHMREAIEVFPERTPDPAWARYVDMFRHALPEELPAGYGHGIVFEAPVIEMPLYLAWLGEQLGRLGVEIVERRLDSLEPALAQASVVVNAAGLGARELVGDPRVRPVRGQIVVVRREPGQQLRVIIDEPGGEDITYVVPRSKDVILGGVANEGVEDLREDPRQTEAIIERCIRLEPRLAGAERLGVRVGLRPYRDVVRLEQEQRDGKLIVHDYGHGGSGVTLSWGCAEEVRDRVLAWLGRGEGA